jgi:hypothetical protein
MITFTIRCRYSDGRGFTMPAQEIHDVASFTTLHTQDVTDLVSATLTYNDGTEVSVNRES